MENYQLNTGHPIPKIGFGTWLIKDGEAAYNAVAEALKIGYRHIDTAQAYQNEASVGQAIQDSGVAREDIFLTTKVWNNCTTVEETEASLEESFAKLKVDYIDLVLIHWPNPEPIRKEDAEAWIERNRNVWQVLESYHAQGRIRSIGVSNFMVHHLESLLEVANVTPAVNQIKLAPGLTQDEVVDFCRQHDIVVEAYSPLGHGTAFNHEQVIAIAEKYPGKTPSQIAIRYSIDKGFLPLPKSETPKHIASNFEVFDFQLDAEDIQILDQVEGVADPVDPDTTDF